jgi:hypothetical protein
MESYLDAVEIARRLGVTYAVRQRLRLRTIWCIDVPYEDQKKLKNGRNNAKRKAAKAKKVGLKPREKAILGILDRMAAKGLPGNMGDLQRQAARHHLFKDLEDIPRQVRRVVDKLVKAGHLGRRLEPRRERGGQEWYVWRETPIPPAHPENVRCKTPIFIGSNHRTNSCAISPEGAIAGHDLDGVEVKDLDEGIPPPWVTASVQAPVLAGAAPGAQPVFQKEGRL